MEAMDVLIIGNGFDRFHGMKTSYLEFIERVDVENSNNAHIKYLKSLCNKDRTWIDIENELVYLYKELSEFVRNGRKHGLASYGQLENFSMHKRNEENIVNFISAILINNKLDGKIEKKFETNNDGTPIEKRGVFFPNEIDGDDFVSYIVNDFEEFINIFLEDFSKLEMPSSKKRIERLLSFVGDIYTFNYTKVIGSVYGRKCEFIHGELEENNIILGVPYINGSFDEYEFNHMSKEQLKAVYGVNKKIVLDGIIGGVKQNVIIIGHSLGKSDWRYFQEVFEAIYNQGGHNSLFFTIIKRQEQTL